MSGKLSEIAQKFLDLKAKGMPAPVLVCAVGTSADVRRLLEDAGAPPDSFVVKEQEEKPDPMTFVRGMAEKMAKDARDPYRLARSVHYKASALLDQYRHNDPAVAAKYRAERAAKKGRKP